MLGKPRGNKTSILYSKNLIPNHVHSNAQAQRRGGDIGYAFGDEAADLEKNPSGPEIRESLETSSSQPTEMSVYPLEV